MIRNCIGATENLSPERHDSQRSQTDDEVLSVFYTFNGLNIKCEQLNVANIATETSGHKDLIQQKNYHFSQ